MASSSGAFKSREEWKAAKELEEARKAGTAPPAIDDDGKIINPHIPEYISRAPWYLGQENPSLKHQKSQQAKKRKFDTLGKWLPRGQTTGPAATKYRKGACENCGAVTHKKKDCLERPRRRGAKLTGRNIRPDEAIGHVNLDFQGKRDRWNGYDEATEYKKVHERYAKLEEQRKLLRAEQLDAALKSGAKVPKTGSDSDDSDDEDIDEQSAMRKPAGQGSKMSVRNLRIREDTAKYLHNLDLNSAFYDPKSRSMRADPNPNVKPEDKDFAGDSFVRFTGDVTKLSQMELHAIRARELGRDIPHLQAEPSRAEALYKEFVTKQKDLEEKRNSHIANKYGGQEFSKPAPEIQGLRQSEMYVEYENTGKPLESEKPANTETKYAEDVLEGDHTEIWGSFYDAGRWGYACCHQTERTLSCAKSDKEKSAPTNQ